MSPVFKTDEKTFGAGSEDGCEVKMIKILNVDKVGEEIQCNYCDAIIHYDPEEDTEFVEYFEHDIPKFNRKINCPNCFSCIYLFGR